VSFLARLVGDDRVEAVIERAATLPPLPAPDNPEKNAYMRDYRRRRAA
jgi:hypothetical protein